ncbi:hypothetical protein AOQ84DRAFT_418820 [Glonium stellatum]|uniref:F-box domain-containing protein n=1 Tax=Glonium stellatum TaxID=574774 RepID=A0A8E2F917_9PEZI|nr:hypothetical protein AOQ84DRAFT_418820 [Glonium stellatum]
MLSLKGSSKALVCKLKDKITTKLGRKRSVKLTNSLESPSPNLLVLPDELLIQIESYLDDQNDVRNACLVSRSLARTSQEKLYRNIDLVHNGKFASGPATYSLRLLLRTLIERSDLASRVKSLNMYIGNYQRSWEDMHGTSDAFNVREARYPMEEILSDFHIQMLSMVVLQLKVPSERPWMLDVRSGCDGALAGVLLAMLPRLSKLKIETARSMPPFLKMLFASDPDGRFPLFRIAGFAGLKDCLISHHMANFSWFGIGKEVPLLGLPYLTTLHLSSLHQPVALPHTRFTNCVGISNVTDLRIEGVNIQNIAQFLGCFKPLRSFAYCGHNVPTLNNIIVDFSDVVPLLYKSYSSLEYLEITLLTDRPDLIYRLVGSLHRFQRLKEFVIPQRAFLGNISHCTKTLIDFLPSSLETLTLVQANNDIWTDLRSFASRKSKAAQEHDVLFAVPNLRNIRLDWRGGACDKDEWGSLSAFMAYDELFDILRDLRVDIEMLGNEANFKAYKV